jgi:hypothetical protein
MLENDFLKSNKKPKMQVNILVIVSTFFAFFILYTILIEV